MQGIVKRVFERICEGETVGHKEFHPFGAGAYKGKIRLQHFVGKKAVTPPSRPLRQKPRWSMSITKAPDGTTMHCSRQYEKMPAGVT